MKRVFSYPGTMALGLLIGLLAGLAGVALCNSIWGSLNPTARLPNEQDFCGRYIPMPSTVRLLHDYYKGAEAWIEIRPGGEFSKHAMPTGLRAQSGDATESKEGKWKLTYSGSRVSLELSGSDGDWSPAFELKGQKPPYVIEGWNEKHAWEMLFCTDPDRSSFAADNRKLSITDYIIQGVAGFCVLILPFLLPAGSGRRAMFYPFTLTLAWGVWRLIYFDSVTMNDVPGVGYLFEAVVYALVARGLHALRSWIGKFRAGAAAD